MFLRHIWALLLLLMPSTAMAQWIAFVRNFNVADYGPAATTWRTATVGGWAYFANQQGLLEYNGMSWNRYQLNNRSEVRSVMPQPDQQRIWVGGEYEFGYFQTTANGALAYHCVSDSLPEKQLKELGNVFDFYELGGVVYARCDFHIIIIAGGTMTVVDSREKIFASTMWNGTLYVATDSGISMLSGLQLVPIQKGNELLHTRINAMIPYRGGFLIASSNQGLFFCNGQEITRYPTSIDVLLRDGTLNAVASKDHLLAFGTLAFGLLVLNTETGQLSKYDNSCGLQSNMVQSLAFDPLGNIWCGLNTGIDYVLLANPFTSLYRAPRSYGYGYTALLDGDKLYLGTNQGLFYAPYPVKYEDRQTVLLGAGIPMGTAWYLTKFDDDVLLMHDRGVFRVKDGKSQLVASVEGAWSSIPVMGHSDMLFVGAYIGVYLLRKHSDGHWENLGRIQGIPEPGRYIRQTKKNELKVYNTRLNTVNVYQLDASLLHVKRTTSGTERYQPDDWTDFERAFPGFDQAIHISSLDDHLKVIPFDEGFMLADLSKMDRERHSVMIEAIYASEPFDSLLYRSNFCGVKMSPKIAYRYKTLRIEYKAAPLYPARNLMYQYRLVAEGSRLKADEGWSEPTLQTFRSLSGLKEGSYTFEVRTVLLSKVQSTDSISFRILPPWYRTWPAYISYLLLPIFLFWYLSRMERRRLARRTAEALEEKNEEVSQMKIEIDKLEKDKMDLDLRHKSQEIANLMINVTRKNEILTEIKTDIKRVAERTGLDDARECKRQLILINNKIDSNMEGDEVLKQFEKEFDLVNDNFIKRLRERHPDLTYNERMICAYLKMGLSTKEIAPLVNVSVRGVETMRYRLRKKLGLSRDNSLSDYLNNF